MEQKASAWMERLHRFVRWFFTVTPEPIADPQPTPRRTGERAKRPGAASLRAHHAGRVPLSRRRKS
jgi:hypothetical protein